MFEIKVAKAANVVYRGIIRASLRSVERRQVRAERKRNRELQDAANLRNMAHHYAGQAIVVEREAMDKHKDATLAVNAATNVLQNAHDDGIITA